MSFARKVLHKPGLPINTRLLPWVRNDESSRRRRRGLVNSPIGSSKAVGHRRGEQRFSIDQQNAHAVKNNERPRMLEIYHWANRSPGHDERFLSRSSYRAG